MFVFEKLYLLFVKERKYML